SEKGVALLERASGRRLRRGPAEVPHERLDIGRETLGGNRREALGEEAGCDDDPAVEKPPGDKRDERALAWSEDPCSFHAVLRRGWLAILQPSAGAPKSANRQDA